MRSILRFLKKIWIFNFIRRVINATRTYNYRYFQILKWGFNSREYTNYTYQLTEDNILYLAQTIADITEKDYQEIYQYILEAENDTELKSAISKAHEKSPLRIFADSEIRFGRRLGWYAMARVLKPGIIVETGIDKGLGAVLLCSALLKNKNEGYEGKYYGTDINPEAGYLLQGKYKEVGTLLYGDSIESLSRFSEKIDLFINDSDHSADYEYREYQAIKDLITDKSIILGDNSHCTNKLALFSIETGRRFIFFQEVPLNHWYPGAGIGISFNRTSH